MGFPFFATGRKAEVLARKDFRAGWGGGDRHLEKRHSKFHF